jgi:heterodisulfide reductase subunit C
MTSDHDVALIAYKLGHSSEGVTFKPRPDRYRWSCKCGYSCTNRRTHELAIEAAVHHLRKVAAEARRQGFQLSHDTPKKQDLGKQATPVS